VCLRGIYAPPKALSSIPNSDIVHMLTAARPFPAFFPGWRAVAQFFLLSVVCPSIAAWMRTALFQVKANWVIASRNKADSSTAGAELLRRWSPQALQGRTSTGQVKFQYWSLFDPRPKTFSRAESKACWQQKTQARDSVLTLLEEELQRTKLHFGRTRWNSRHIERGAQKASE